MEVAYPFLMYVYNDYNNNKITREDFIKILRFTESYVFRRAICEIPTNSLNKTFAVMRNKINANDYVNSICANYILLDSYKEFPKDDEFSQRFVEKDIYHMRIRQYILGKLERYNNKEKLDLGSFTIEHVMPENENLRNGWKEALGEDWQAIHTQYLSNFIQHIRCYCNVFYSWHITSLYFTRCYQILPDKSRNCSQIHQKSLPDITR